MEALGFPYTDEEISGLGEKDDMDALVAYMQVIGNAVTSKAAAEVKPRVKAEVSVNPLAGDPNAIKLGKELYEDNCEMCHGEGGEGDIGPSLIDSMFLYEEGDLPDNDYFEIINNGTFEGMVEDGRTAEGGMPPFGDEMQKDEIWSVISYIRSLQRR
jgi:mono/diheme cytochrome c family protein